MARRSATARAPPRGVRRLPPAYPDCAIVVGLVELARSELYLNALRMYKCLHQAARGAASNEERVPGAQPHEASLAVPAASDGGRAMRPKTRRVGMLLGLAATVGLISVPTGLALSGTASYAPAESNIAGKYWVSASATGGDAKL
jgi:hypothetical protein